MDPFIDRTPPAPNEAEELAGMRAVDAVATGAGAHDRMQAGLAIAVLAGRELGGNPQVEDRRFAMAFARGLARMRTAGDEAPALGSVDWARVFTVDASIQREAEKSLGMDVLDREARHRWGSKWARTEQWVQAGVAPSVFGKAAEEELVSMAAGRFHEILPGRGRGLETALMSSMAPAMPSLERTLHEVAQTPMPISGVDGLGAVAARMDERRFGPLPAGPDGVEMATLSDRIELAARAREVGARDARGLHDPTPGRHPAAVSSEHVAKARAAMAGGMTSLARIAAGARAVEGDLGLVSDGREAARLESALARLVKRGPDPAGGMKGDVRGVVADMLIQRSAADRLAGRGTASAEALERFVSNTPGGRDAVRFTGMASDRASVAAMAEGRFADVDDSRGYASAARNSVWRAGMGSSPAIDASLDRAWAARSPSKGPGDMGAQFPPRQARGGGR